MRIVCAFAMAMRRGFAWWAAPFVFALALGNTAIAQRDEPRQETPDGLLLIQSELSYLENADRPIELEIKNATPVHALQQIGRATGITIEVQGELPSKPMLTATFRDVPAQEVLEWFSDEVQVIYRAESSRELMVFVASTMDA